MLNKNEINANRLYTTKIRDILRGESRTINSYMDTSDITPPTNATNSYGFRIRILGNEVFSIELISSDGSNRWVALGLLSIFSLMVTLGAFGDKFIALYHILLP